MKLTYEDKLKIIELYNQGYSMTAISKKMNAAYTYVLRMIKRFMIHGEDSLKHPHKNKFITTDIKLEIINKWKCGTSLTCLVAEYLVTDAQIIKWVKKYEEFGYNGLKIDKRGRPRKMDEKKDIKISPKPLDESEREELIRLREQNKQLEMENYLLKKLKALVQQRNQQPQKKK